MDPPWYSVYSSPIWKKLSARVIREEPVCHWCGMAPSEVGDHVVPLADGGAAFARANVVGACTRCNVSRGQRDAQRRRVVG